MAQTLDSFRSDAVFSTIGVAYTYRWRTSMTEFGNFFDGLVHLNEETLSILKMTAFHQSDRRVNMMNGHDRIADLESALKTAAVAMDLQSGWKIDEEAFKRVQKRYGGGMAGAYIKVCEALVGQKEKEDGT